MLPRAALARARIAVVHAWRARRRDAASRYERGLSALISAYGETRAKQVVLRAYTGHCAVCLVCMDRRLYTLGPNVYSYSAVDGGGGGASGRVQHLQLLLLCALLAATAVALVPPSQPLAAHHQYTVAEPIAPIREKKIEALYNGPDWMHKTLKTDDDNDDYAKPSQQLATAAVESCVRHEDCPTGQYCDLTNQCYNCSYITTKCDAVGKDCCSQSFLCSCPSNPMHCQNNVTCDITLDHLCGLNRSHAGSGECLICAGQNQNDLQRAGCNNNLLYKFCMATDAHSSCPDCRTTSDCHGHESTCSGNRGNGRCGDNGRCSCYGTFTGRYCENDVCAGFNCHVNQCSISQHADGTKYCKTTPICCSSPVQKACCYGECGNRGCYDCRTIPDCRGGTCNGYGDCNSTC